jgi:hypothetical protein
MQRRDEKFVQNFSEETLEANGGLDQWYSTWGTRRHLRGYVKFKKKMYYFMINTE